MLTLHVAQLLKDEPGARRSFELTDPSPELEEVRLAAPLEVRGALQKTRRGVLLTADYSTVMLLACGRCLDDYQLEVEGHYQDELLAPGADQTRRAVAADEDSPRISDEFVIELSEIIRQELLLEAPLQPICQPECPGLCESCGADLRAGPCACGQPIPDGPFAALRQLIQQPDPKQTNPHTTQEGM